MAKRLKSPKEAARELRGETEEEEQAPPAAPAAVETDDLESAMGDILEDADDESDDPYEDVEDASESEGSSEATEESEAPVEGAGGDGEPESGESTSEEGDESEPDPFLTRLADLGFEGVEDRSQAEQRLIEAFVEQRQQSQTQAQQFEQWRRQMEAELAAQRRVEQRQPQQQQQQKGHLASIKPPHVDMDLARKYMVPETDSEGKATGGWGWKADTPSELKGQVEAYQTHLAKWQEDLLTRPHEVLPKIFQEVAAPMIQQYLGQYQSEVGTQSAVERFMEESKDWAYQKDPVTGGLKVVDGQYVFTPAGQKFVQDWDYFADRGMSEQEAYQLAMERRRLGLLEAGAQPEDPKNGKPKPDVKKQAAAKKREALERGRRGSGKEERPARHGGSFPGPGDGSSLSQNPYEDTREFLLASLKEEGMDLS